MAKSNNYWVQRINEENQNFYKRRVRQTQEELRKLYDEQGRKLYDEINRVFLKMVSDAEDGKVYLNDLYRTNNYHLLLNYFNKCAKTIGGKQVKITEKHLIEAYNRARQIVEDLTPQGIIRPTFVVPSAVDAEQVVRQVWCMDGKNFSDRIWLNKDKLVGDLASTLGDFVMRGETPYAISQGIVKRLAVDEYSAYRIARTETAHAQIVGQVSKYKEMGFTHGRFNASDPCDDCGKLDGQLFTLDELQTMIPRHPNCECSFLLEV